MRTDELEQPPYDTSMMGVVKGALDHYRIACTPGRAFFLSGHAFVINVHEELCPSGPYCWRCEGLFDLLRNLGLDMEPLGMLMPSADAAAKAELEAKVRAALDDGAVCSLLNLDNQLVLGYDDVGFVMAQPWGEAIDSTPARLSFGTWSECQAGPPVTFFRHRPCERPAADPIAAALDFALDVWRQPQRFAEERYGVGAGAYANWIAALDGGHGGEHGNWWNGVVWAECRQRAGDYFQDLAAAEIPVAIDRQQARQLAIAYRDLAKLLYRVSDKTASDADKRGFVEAARELEANCIERIAELRDDIGTPR